MDKWIKHMAANNSAIVQEFLIESFENLSVIGEELTQFEKDGSNYDLLNAIYRKVHTLKGSASFLGLQKLQEITHSGENVLDYLREGKLKIDPEIIDVLLESFDASIELLKNIEETGAENDKDYSSIIKKFVSILESKTLGSEAVVGSSPTVIDSGSSDAKVEGKSTQKVEASKVKEEPKPEPKVEVMVEKPKDKKPKDQVVKAAKSEAPKATPKKEVKVKKSPTKEAPKAAKPSVKEATGAPAPSSGGNSGGSLKDSVVRVNVQLLDKIMNVVGELVLNRNQILQYANAVDSGELTRLAQQLNVITTELQTDIMTTRMQPVGSVLSKFERIVRDLSRSQNKIIALTISGKDTELDKTLLEAIRDPLTHLIRNSVDHGVELPAERSKVGKSDEGNIKIRAYHEGGQVTIEISDDGNGIDTQKVLAKAVSKGMFTEAQGAEYSEKQVLNLIFNPGFSTAEKVTNISGRGVGMDVVKSNIEKIGGSVDVFSKLGEGTTFKLKIPLTLAIVPALVVESTSETFAIPQINLVELVRLDGKEVEEYIEDIHDSEFFRLRGDLIPIFRLNDSLKLDKINHDINHSWEKEKNAQHQSSKHPQTHEGSAKETKSNGKEKELEEFYQKISGARNESRSNNHVDDGVNIVILNADGRIYGLIVDQISDTEEIVVKPLSRKLKSINAFAGATIMGDGRVSLILDALGFFNSVDKGSNKGEKDTRMGEDKSNFSRVETQEVLLTILGDDRPYGIPLVLVNRLEEFQVKDVEWSGDQPLIRYGDIPMPLINLEKTLNLKGVSVIDAKKDLVDEGNQVVPCVVVRIRNQYFGLVVYEIHDIAISEDTINSDTIDREGLLGTIYLNKKTVTLVDVHSILDMQKIGYNVIGKNRKGHIQSRGKVLLVEDSPLYRRIESEFLIEHGFEVVEGFNGKEALDILKNNGENFNLIITDVDMPVMDGFELAEKVRASSESFNETPILALSTNVSERDMEKGIKAGFNAHEEKFNREHVLKILDDFLGTGE